jgi:NADH dehydrogenase
MHVVLVGGSGFLGRYLVRELVANGHHCTVLSRHADRRRSVALQKGARLVQANVFDEDGLAAAIAGADAVVSMAGILNEGGSRDNRFERVHHDLPVMLANVSRDGGVTRFLHVSALNAGKGDSRYLSTKGRAEESLRAVKGLDLTIFQPSVIFGRGDSFFNRFAALLKMAPVMPLACAQSKMQPVHAGDVAASMVASIDLPAAIGQTYELGGPDVYSLKELVQFTADTLGIRRLIIPLPDMLSRLQAMMLGLVPGKPFSLDNYRSLQVDNVTERNALRIFDIQPASIERLVPDYLGVSRHQQRLTGIRSRARR